MTYGIETFRADGSKVMSGATKGLVYIETISVTGSTSGSSTYTQVSGNSIVAFAMIPRNEPNTCVLTPSQNGSGQGVLSWTTNTYNGGTVIKILVFATKLAVTNLYGIIFNNDIGETLVDLTLPVPQYAGSIQPNVNATLSRVGYSKTVYEHSTAGFNFRPGTTRFVAMAIPDNGSTEIWYGCESYIPAGETNPVFLKIRVVAPNGVAYTVPKLYVYSVDAPSSGGSTFGTQVLNASGGLVYDSSADNVSISDSLSLSFAIGSPTTSNLAFPSSAGVVAPFAIKYVTDDINGVSVQSGYMSMVRRQGNQLVSAFVGLPMGQDFGSSNFGNTTGYCAIIDVALAGALGAANGTPSATYSVPTISVQPSNTSVNSGSAGSFSVTGTGNPAPSYQWRRNGSNISGANSATYSFTGGTGNASGDTFLCLLSNTEGSILSSSATLTLVSSLYPSYNAIPYEEVIEYDMAASWSISGQYGAWHNGSGDWTLYDVMAESANGGAMSGSPMNTWIPFTSSNTPSWSLNPPGYKQISRYRTLTIKVRVRSTGTVVSQGNIYLESVSSEYQPP